MTRAHIEFQDEAGRTTVAFHPAPPRIAPDAWAWRLIGGAALGLAGAVTLIVLGVAGVDALGPLIGALTVPGALLIDAAARLTVRRGPVMQASFDVLSGFMTVSRRGRRAPLRFTVHDVAGFRLIEAEPRGALLVMDTHSQGEVLLISTRRRRAAQRGLQGFADRLNVALESAAVELHAMPRPRTSMQPPMASPRSLRRTPRPDSESADPYDSDPHRPAGFPPSDERL